MDSPRLGISAHAAATPNKAALVCGTVTRTFADFDDRTTRLAAALAERGVQAGDRVAIMVPNSIEFFETWAAATKLHAPVVLVNYHLKADELAYILDDSEARVLVAHRRLAPRYERALAGVATCDVIVVPDEYETAIQDHRDASPRSIEALDAPIFYTSGTTGRPKGVVHGRPDPDRARQNMAGQLALWGWTEDDTYILTGPAYHAGPGGWAMAALYVGATSIILDSFDAAAWLALVDAHHVTRTFMVPAHFIRILEVPEAERRARDVSSLELIVHAGAPCPVPVKRRIIEALGPCEIAEVYGMSEGGATRISMTEWLERPGSVGLPWPGTEVRILDAEDGHPLGVGETGVIYVRPPGGARFHYHDDDAKTAGAWRDDAFTVGDVGHLDADGYLYLTDRAVDMVIRGGVNVYPSEIEEVLYTHPAVVDCAVFGVPDDELGEQLMAVVETRSPATAEELRGFCRDHLADFKVPAHVELVEELPRQPNGKVLKRVLREQHWAGRATRI
ncbi:MAG TPA: AMP-binding protein [Acidimicrobiia bacterium]|nr:AMP-binding protein [Acidimicrobiia bacterium]